MPDPTKITIAEWWKYECSVFRRAASEIKASNFVEGGTIAVIAAGITYYGLTLAGIAKEHETAVTCIISACAGVAAFILVFGAKFLVKLLGAPAKMEKEASEKVAPIEKRFAEMEERIVTAHKKHTDLLESQIQTLQTRLDERGKRKVNKDILGAYLEQLQLRILAIEKMGLFGYWDCVKGENDQESDALVGKIRKYIAENIGLGEAASFSNLSGIKLVRFDESLGLSDTMEKKKAWLHKINHLDHYSIQLKEIIKNYHAEIPPNH